MGNGRLVFVVVVTKDEFVIKIFGEIMKVPCAGVMREVCGD